MAVVEGTTTGGSGAAPVGSLRAPQRAVPRAGSGGVIEGTTTGGVCARVIIEILLMVEGVLDEELKRVIF